MSIAVLDQNTINKIAAGEVVERPSSVVKELVENAIDAKATAITVEIKDGGTSLIRITDNGSGIAKEDIQIAFLRHSTSKIKSVEDLMCISSLGFRGEALSSISSVAQVELITKTAQSMTGTRYLIDGGHEKSIEEIGAPEGTTFLIRNLFYNTPARRKFLKSNTTEGSYISDLIEHLALSHPDISFRFINNNQNKLYTSGNSNLKDIIYGIYGRDITACLLPIKSENDFLTMEGFIGKPQLGRGNRNYENYYINGRFIKSRVVSKAIEDAYSNFMMQHRYPFTAIHFHISSEMIDVNVHPTKMELRFSDNEKVYDIVFNTVKDVLSGRQLIPDVKIDEPKEHHNTEVLRPEPVTPIMTRNSVPLPKPAVHQAPLTGEAHNEIPKSDTSRSVSSTEQVTKEEISRVEVVKSVESKVENSTKALQVEPPKETQASRPEPQNERIPEPFEVRRNQVLREKKPEYTYRQEDLFESRQLLAEESIKEHKIIGQLFDTYWLIEFDNKLYIIDQHAAHEKVLYEKFMAKLESNEVNTQMLNPPIILTLNMHEEEILKNNLETFADMGFEIEPFGGNEYAVRGIPENLYSLNSKELLTEMIDSLEDDNRSKTPESIKHRIATMSCKAAVKGNNKLSYAEASSLIKQLLDLENPYNCPHGRPTLISISKSELEKKFKRIV